MSTSPELPAQKVAQTSPSGYRGRAAVVVGEAVRELVGCAMNRDGVLQPPTSSGWQVWMPGGRRTGAPITRRLLASDSRGRVKTWSSTCEVLNDGHVLAIASGNELVVALGINDAPS